MAETAGLAIGAVSLLSLAATCADAYRLRTALRDYQSDGSALLMKIDIERARFYICLKGLGIVEAKLDEQLLLEPGIIQLVMKVLYQIQGTLKETAKITGKYHLSYRKNPSCPANHEGHIKERPEARAMPSITSLPRDFWEHHGLTIEENGWQKQPESQLDETNISYRRKLKWAIIDKSRLTNLVENLRIYNDSLASLVPHLQTVTTKRLPSLILPRISDEETMKSIQDASADSYHTLSQAANFREVMRKSLERIQSESVADNKWRIKNGPIFALSELFSGYFTGEYLGTSVVVEKKAIVTQRNNFCLTQRVDALAQLLMEETKPTDFRILHCLGYETMSSSYWFIFRFPNGSNTSIPPSNLARIISSSNKPSVKSNPYPTANERLKLGYQAALSLLQIHSVNWLHKDIKPDNLLLFAKEGSQDYDLTQPWLAGFSYSRPFSAHISTDLQRRDATDLYLAPAYKQVAGSLTRYQKRYDIYSLGLILFEIGIWDTLENCVSITCDYCLMGEKYTSFHPQIMEPGAGCKFDVAYHFAKDNLHLLDDFAPEYRIVVEKCLAGLLRSTSSSDKFDPIGGWREWDDNADEAGELDQKFTMEVVQELEKLMPDVGNQSRS